MLPSDTLESIKEKGRQMEAKTLVDAIKLYLENKLEVYLGTSSGSRKNVKDTYTNIHFSGS